MYAREIKNGIEAIICAHWERRMFDALIPLPDGTSYNAYIVRGRDATVLIDAADPELRDDLMGGLRGVEKIDYIVSQHSEQDHSGLIPELLERYPQAVLICSTKARDLVMSHLHVPEARIRVVEDGEELELGGKTLRFIYTPWVHWPETMCSYVPEDRCLFTCDFFGSHLATSELFVSDQALVYEAAKRYYAEIMMPFRKIISKNLDKLGALDFDMIAPSHGPIYDQPGFIVEAYRDWVSPKLKNEVVLPYISMHGSTSMMARHLIDALARRGIKVHVFDLAVTDIGKLAMALVDAATLIVGTPTVHVGPHPAVFYAAHLANMLKPKLKYAAVFGSYGWGSKAAEQITELIPHLKVDLLGAVVNKGMPVADTFASLDALADTVAQRHADDPDVV
jgi:flavorubredoxin